MINDSRLERWLGPCASQLAESTASWYGSPIPVANVPGRVSLGGQGYTGQLRGGAFASYLDWVEDRTQRLYRAWKRSRATFYAGFPDLVGLIANAKGGRQQVINYIKSGTGATGGMSCDLWPYGPLPAAGSASAAAPGGTAFDASSTGAFPLFNPAVSIDFMFCTGWRGSPTLGGQTLMLYDRLFGVAKTMSSSTAETVTGVPTRYQSTTATDWDAAVNNFLMPTVTATMSATAHNWDGTYVSCDGSAKTLPTITGQAVANTLGRLDIPGGQWFAPLATGCRGIASLTQMQCSVNTLTGGIAFVIGHPLAFLPHATAFQWTVIDGINSAFQMTRIFNDACLTLLEPLKQATGAATYYGNISITSG